ncbi:MAG: MopE-related protein [Chitinophagales bacterium]
MKLFFTFHFQLSVFYCFTQTAPEIEWQNVIGGEGDDELTYIVQTSDGGYIVGGNSSSTNTGDKIEIGNGFTDFWVLKLDSLGNIEWQNTIGGDYQENLVNIIELNDGNYILASNSSSGISGDLTEDTNNGDFWILKIDSIGNITWQKTIGSDNWDYMIDFVAADDGGYFIGATSYGNISGDKTENSIGEGDFWIVKLDSALNIVWDNTIGTTLNDGFGGLDKTNDGGCIIGGYTNAGISGDKTEAGIGGNDYWILRLDSTGTIEWQNTIGGSFNDYLRDIEYCMDGGAIICGESTSYISGDKTENPVGTIGYSDYWIVKIDSVGNIEWENTIGGNNADYPKHIFQTLEGGYIIGGDSGSEASGDKSENVYGNNDFWIVKLNGIGLIEWDNNIGAEGTEWFKSINSTNDGGFILGGPSNSIISGDKTESIVGLSYGGDYWVIKLFPEDCSPDTYYVDADSDGFGNELVSVLACTLPDGYVNNHHDCDDTDPEIYPFADEVCNSLDDDCDGDIDEELLFATYYADNDEDGYGNEFISVFTCEMPDGYVLNNTDCNDASFLIYPGATEICNTIDDNCTGVADEGLVFIFFLDADEDGFGDATTFITDCEMPLGYVVNNLDCNDVNEIINPDAIEICNEIDDNCNGYIDEDLLLTFFADADEDGFGNADEFILGCSLPEGYVENYFDCNDNNNAINPLIDEICNGLDDDCDEAIDDELTYFILYIDSDGDNYGNGLTDTTSCYAAIIGYVSDNTDCDDNNSSIFPGAPETSYNGIDEDCNGEDLITSISNFEDGYLLLIHPNPTKSVLFIETTGFANEINITVSNTLGEEVMKQFVKTSEQLSVDVSNLSVGVYTITIEDGARVATEKFMKE